MATLGTALALMLAPLGAGWLAGVGLRRLRRGRASGILWPLVALFLAVGVLLALDVRSALVGVWDAGVVAVLLVVGLLVALHRAFADPRNLVLSVGASVFGLLLLELAGRLVLPPPPAFPSQSGPELFLSDALRVSAQSGMSATVGQQLVCRLIYGPPAAADSTPALIPFAESYVPRAGVSARVLHLGDSVVYGNTVDGRFTDDLAKLEPNVEHINAAVFATAPDAYISIMRRWVAQQPIDAVVMHLNPNDTLEIDGPYPCAGWHSLLVYDDGVPHLRYATDHSGDPNPLRLLLQNSPPPYLLRAAVRFSASAAHGAAACVQLGRRFGYASATGDYDLGVAHIEMILRAARDELRARHIALVAEILHFRFDAEAGVHQTNLKAIPEKLGIVTLDSWDPLIASLARGEQPFTNAGGPTDSHFSAAGHAMMAKWLHEQLPAAIEQARSR